MITLFIGSAIIVITFPDVLRVQVRDPRSSHAPRTWKSSIFFTSNPSFQECRRRVHCRQLRTRFFGIRATGAVKSGRQSDFAALCTLLCGQQRWSPSPCGSNNGQRQGFHFTFFRGGVGDGRGDKSRSAHALSSRSLRILRRSGTQG